MRPSYGHFARLLEIILPKGGYVMAVIDGVEGYFDESGTHADSRFECAAGYIFLKQDAEALLPKWKAMLDKYRLPYFHMKDCAHFCGIYSHLSEQECIDAARQAIELIKSHATLGLAASVDLRALDLLPRVPHFNTVYTFLCLQMLIGTKLWADEEAFYGDIAYVFETGAAHRGEADAFMHKTFKHPELKRAYRHKSHAFVGKEDAPLLQCADLLAWHWYTKNRRESEGTKKLRKDFQSLIGVKHRVNHYSRESITRWRAALSDPRAIEWANRRLIPRQWSR